MTKLTHTKMPGRKEAACGLPVTKKTRLVSESSTVC